MSLLLLDLIHLNVFFVCFLVFPCVCLKNMCVTMSAFYIKKFELTWCGEHQCSAQGVFTGGYTVVTTNEDDVFFYPENGAARCACPISVWYEDIRMV